jgi:hypothetical protein
MFTGPTSSNFAIKRDEKFNRVTSSTYRNNNPRKLAVVNYSQVENSGSQAVLSLVRTQVVNDALGANSIINEILWNPVNNRFNFIDANVGDYFDLNIVFNITIAGVIQASAQLDFSPALDGSQVVSAKVTHLVVPTSGADSLFF